MRVTLNGIKRRGDQWKGAANWNGRLVFIWSAEHRAWWRSNGNGYTTAQDGAGIYNFQDALARTRHCGPEKKIEFHDATPEADGEE